MPDAEMLGGFFAWLTVPCGAATAFGLLLWAEPQAPAELAARGLTTALAAAAMVVVLLILAGAF